MVNKFLEKRTNEIDKKRQGRLNKQNGRIWELIVRKNLESKGYIVSKWQNNIDLEKNILHSCKRKFNIEMYILRIEKETKDNSKQNRP